MPTTTTNRPSTTTNNGNANVTQTVTHSGSFSSDFTVRNVLHKDDIVNSRSKQLVRELITTVVAKDDLLNPFLILDEKLNITNTTTLEKFPFAELNET